MTKQDKIGVVLRKLDYLWSKKGKTFCQAVKEVLDDKVIFTQEDISDDDVIELVKNIDVNDKSEKY